MFQTFFERVEAQGGRILTERCTPERLPPATAGQPEIPTGGCGQPTKIELPYADEDGSPQRIIACVGCDGALYWPRLATRLA